jgi:sugar O-acyltransferase (sialic acid O-acetyltransferase NeuD family)
MPRLVIFGVGEIAEVADFYFRTDSDYQVAAFTVDAQYAKEPQFCGRPVVPLEEVAKTFPPVEYDAFVGVGYSKLNALRRGKAEALRGLGYRLASYVSSKATTFRDFTAGDNCLILEDNTVQPFTRIGNNVTLWSGNHIGHHVTIGDNCFIASHVVVSGGVTIGDSTFIGVNATLRDHIKVGSRCVIGAGAILMEDAPDEAVYATRGTERAAIPSSRLRSL